MVTRFNYVSGLAELLCYDDMATPARESSPVYCRAVCYSSD